MSSVVSSSTIQGKSINQLIISRLTSLTLIIGLIVFSSFFVSASASSLDRYSKDEGCELRLELTGMATAKGSIRLTLFNQAKGFPSADKLAAKLLSVPAQKGRQVVVITGLQPGQWAIAAYHDENDNGKMDTNWLGVPKEKYGASNNARGTMGPPAYSDAKIVIVGASASHSFELK